MTAREAKEIIKENDKKVIECCDFGLFYGFVFGEDGEEIGTAYTCVDKESGRVFAFAPFDDFDLFDKGKQVPLSEL